VLIFLLYLDILSCSFCNFSEKSGLVGNDLTPSNFCFEKIVPKIDLDMISELNFNLIDYDDQIVKYISNRFVFFEFSEKNQRIIKIASAQENFPIISGLFF